MFCLVGTMPRRGQGGVRGAAQGWLPSWQVVRHALGAFWTSPRHPNSNVGADSVFSRLRGALVLQPATLPSPTHHPPTCVQTESVTTMLNRPEHP